MYRPNACTWRAPSVSGAPAWCFAHMYDPEGALATVPTVMSVWLGAHFGRVLKFEGLQGSSGRILGHWSACAATLMVLGIALHLVGLGMNKQLWSTSYLLFTAGSCGGALAFIYLMVDATAPTGRWHGCCLAGSRKVTQTWEGPFSAVLKLIFTAKQFYFSVVGVDLQDVHSSASLQIQYCIISGTGVSFSIISVSPMNDLAKFAGDISQTSIYTRRNI